MSGPYSLFMHTLNQFSLHHQLEKLMKKLKPINLFRVIINPESFSQSVENMFYLSFLIRDGKIDLNFEDDEPIIRELCCHSVANFVC